VLRARVIRRKCDADGKEIGTCASKLILDTREYEVEFQDGSTDVFTVNVIAENLFSQVDDEGRSQVMMDEITDHKCDGSAVSKDDGFEVTKSGQRRPATPKANYKGLVFNGFLERWIIGLGPIEGPERVLSRQDG